MKNMELLDWLIFIAAVALILASIHRCTYPCYSLQVLSDGKLTVLAGGVPTYTHDDGDKVLEFYDKLENKCLE